jgi:hypothetical protein
MITKTNLLLLSLFSFSLLFGAKDPMKFGKVPKEDLAMTSYEKFPDAEALVLGDYGKLTFNVGPTGMEYFLYRHKRIKIFKQSGFEVGDISIDYYKGSQVKRLKALVTNPDGSEYEVDKDQIFETKINDYWTSIKFAFPNLQEGSVIEYRYDLVSDDLFSLEDWYFQGEIPTRFSELRTEIIQYLKYAKWFNGYGTLAVQDCSTNSTSLGGESISIDECRYVAEDLPGLKPEAYISTMRDYYFRIKFQLKAIEIPGSVYENYMTTWENVANELLENANFGYQYLKKSNYNKLYEETQSLVATASPNEKVEILSKYLAKNIESIARYNTFFTRGTLDKAYENKVATAAERNLMLLALLREHGLKAYPVLVSSLKNGKPVTQYPFISQFDHVIVYTELDGEGTFIDITNPLLPYNLPTPSALNKAGLLITAETVGWVELKPAMATSKYIFNLHLNKEGSIEGNLSTSHEGYAAYNERVDWQDDKEGKFWTERLRETHPEASIKDLSCKNMEDINAPLQTSFQFSIEDAAMVAGNRIYVSPILFTEYRENYFKKEKRYFPVEMAYPSQEQEIINLTIPEGYLIESVPESVNVSLPNKTGSFRFLVNPKGNLIQIISKIEFAETFYGPDEYDALRNFMDMIVQKMGEQIVLRKA